jgi:hypothetical protein
VISAVCSSPQLIALTIMLKLQNFGLLYTFPIPSEEIPNCPNVSPTFAPSSYFPTRTPPCIPRSAPHSSLSLFKFT